MKSLAITHRGLEKISAQEIKELVGAETSTESSVVLFETDKITDLCLLCYKAQSLMRVLYLLKKIKFKSMEDVSKAAETTDFSEFVGKKTKFAVRCEKTGAHDFSSAEIEDCVGSAIEGKVDLENPDVIVFVHICDDSCYIGIDFAGRDLSKRHYRIFANNEQTKATVAYCALRIADYGEKDVLLDPFCAAGTILIEAALYACGFPVNFFNKEKFAFHKLKQLKDKDAASMLDSADKNARLDKKIKVYGFDNILNRVISSRKNSKIAGVDKKITFSKVDIEWMDTKLEKGSVDRVVSNIPFSTADIKNTQKLYKEFFYQLDYVLSERGKVVLITRNNGLLEKAASESKFRIVQNIQIEQGKQPLKIIVIMK